jgi:hypothetical protein
VSYGVSIVKLKTFGANFIGSPPCWADGTKTHITALMCVDAIESKYQLLNEYKLLFDLVVHQQTTFVWFLATFLVRLAKFERNFTKRNFYFITWFMSKHNFNFETEGV